jgi:hypothetical protein
LSNKFLNYYRKNIEGPEKHKMILQIEGRTMNFYKIIFKSFLVGYSLYQDIRVVFRIHFVKHTTTYQCLTFRPNETESDISMPLV